MNDDDRIITRLRRMLAGGAASPPGLEQRVSERLQRAHPLPPEGPLSRVPEAPVARWRRRPRLALEVAVGLVAAVAVIAGTIAVPRLGSGPAQPSPPPTMAGTTPSATPSATPVAGTIPPVQQQSYQPCRGEVQPVAGGEWLVAGGRLLLTTDGGTTWHDTTPANIGAVAAGPGLFCALSARQAWLVTATPGLGHLNVLRTSDGGLTWSVAGEVHYPGVTAGGADPASLEFVDAERGWLMLEIPGMAKNAVLFATSDGGRTWTQLATASIYAGTLDFVSATQGWLAFAGGGGPGGPALYRSTDAGSTWSTVPQPFLPLVGQDACTYLDAFRFLSSTVGVAASDDVGCPGKRLEVWVTTDAGTTWQEKATVADDTTGSDYTCGFDVITASVWVRENGTCAAGTPPVFDWTVDGGAHWETVTPHGLPSGVLSVTFVSSRFGLAVGSATTPHLYRTTDSGRTWSEVGLPGE